MLALGEISAVAIQPQAEEPEPPCWGPSQPWQLLVFCGAKGSVKGGRGRMVFPTMMSMLFPQQAQLCGHRTSTPSSQETRSFLDPVRKATQKGRSTGCGKSIAEEAKLQRPQPLGGQFFSPTKLGRCPPALACPHYKGKIMDIHPTTTTRPLSGMGKEL